MVLARVGAWLSGRFEGVLAWIIRVAGRPRARTGILVVLVLLAIAGLHHHSQAFSPGAGLLALLGTVPLFLLRRYRTGPLVVVLAANSVFILFSRLTWPAGDVLAWLVVLAAMPVLLSRRRASAVLLLTLLVILTAALMPPTVSRTSWDAAFAESVGALLAWALGVTLADRQRLASERRAAAARMRELQESDATSRGRVGIARELHDVVAHHVSLVAVRAATARYAVPDLSPAAERAFDEIAEQARTALTELRTVLGVLRTPEHAADQAPQPSLAELGPLVDRVRSAGSRVSLVSTGDGADLPEPVQLTAYRIVQEALTNASRYAPGAPVQVELRRDGGALVVSVQNDASPTAPAAPKGSGLGLVGMRERVAMLGGTLRAGGLDGGGFLVSAVLPLPAGAVLPADTRS